PVGSSSRANLARLHPYAMVFGGGSLNHAWEVAPSEYATSGQGCSDDQPCFFEDVPSPGIAWGNRGAYNGRFGQWNNQLGGGYDQSMPCSEAAADEIDVPTDGTPALLRAGMKEWDQNGTHCLSWSKNFDVLAGNLAAGLNANSGASDDDAKIIATYNAN